MSRPHRLSVRLRSALRVSAVAATLTLVATHVLLGGGQVAASSAAAQIAPATEPTVPVMIVLDASGSMNQADAPGPRIVAAKAAVTSLIDSLPAQTQVGLQVYGTSTGSTDAEKAAGCADIRTLVPVGPLDAASLKTQIGAVTASGYTPIGNALRAAADALPNEGPRSIVLVSDGEDTCAPPAPCDVAKELKQQGIDLVVHTIGFKVDDAARDQLSCVATATGGTYSDATDATGLTQALTTKVDYAITGYTTAGTPITGADQASEQAPQLEPGQYVDTLAEADSALAVSDGTVKYYTVPVRAGVRLYVSVTIVPPSGSPATDIKGFGTDVDLLRSNLDSCSSDYGRTVEVVDPDRQMAVTTVLAQDIGGTRYPSRCPQQGVLILQIQRLGTAYQGHETPIEIAIRAEPAADASAVPPPADKATELASPVHGASSQLTGGDSFNNAPEITSGVTYSDNVVTGDTRYFRIPLQWGQRFSYLLTPVGNSQPGLIPGAYVSVDVFNPVRQDVEMSNDDIGGAFWFTSGLPNPLAASTVYPARYSNRTVLRSAGYSLDGDYYLRLTIPSTDQPSAEGYLLTVVVSGEVEAGPVYQAGATSSTVTPSTSTSSTAAPSTAGTTSPTAPTAETPNNPATNIEATAGSTTTDSGVPGWVWAVAGALVAGAVAALLFVRYRRPAPASPNGSDHNDQGDRR